MNTMVRSPVNEAERMLSVRSLISGNTIASTPELSALAELAKGVFHVPTAAINIIDEDWQRVAYQAGVPIAECPRELSICTRVVVANEFLVIPDMTKHPEIREAPYVTGDPGFRFYAGVPVALEPNLPVGAFCLIDVKPREFSDADIEQLEKFAFIASALLRLQKTNLIMQFAERELRTAAMTDPLTGFYNRTALPKIVDVGLAAAMTSAQTFGVLYLDMDGFKSINDKLGHAMGDEVLCEAALRIREVLRAEDVCVRMGGDEFAIFMSGSCDAAGLMMVSEKLLSAFRRPFHIDGHTIKACLSIGAALAPQAGAERVQLLRNVDTALYRAKKAGRDCVVVFEG
ncbi:sensor domain-containing diguanylate cyclase [Neorhizobium sp. T786]|uniref:sensor domain-containing diguanylate cyclase n=1 Tax=Pseudorhizobium xiangyangii TaxID=2883104 RepID=UPI001CFF8620|nr:sensor domain-containing diguanylate cyclase [Neorhizobium xiangyangii]MCB5202300.1 sensor domain-containing diguanylate cyclase [Neorhizobium xiangyangii]